MTTTESLLLLAFGIRAALPLPLVVWERLILIIVIGVRFLLAWTTGL